MTQYTLLKKGIEELARELMEHGDDYLAGRLEGMIFVTETLWPLLRQGETE